MGAESLGKQKAAGSGATKSINKQKSCRFQQIYRRTRGEKLAKHLELSTPFNKSNADKSRCKSIHSNSIKQETSGEM